MKMAKDDIMIETSLAARLWNEFEAQNTLSVTTAASPLTAEDNGFHGVFGEVNAALNVSFKDSGTSFFIKSDMKFKDDVTSAGLNAGLRYTW